MKKIAKMRERAATLLDAAAAWNCSPSTARTRLGAAIGAGLVMYAGEREDRLYSPTLKLLNLMMEEA